MVLLLMTSLAISGLDDELTLPAWPLSMHAERRDGGTWLDGPTSRAVHERLLLLDRMPELARAIGDSRVSEAIAIANQEHQIDMAQQAMRIERLERERWTPLQRVGAVLGGAVVGAAVGFLAAALVHP